ncbi:MULTISPECIES: MarR family winged helix-turn-helix transcriptional regulator [Paenibacillus]|uniref:MarR family winged helix-turn-helix transcriptional regulator n=1 Tax=Paenibacillus TaxID=44249 RepID=UPI00119CB133|nr:MULTISPECIES: MarR family transcriptional regulator [Paenibacillus]GIO60598.1 MarR family transcriptional regulator [Paenibacillus cineris]
MKKNAATMFSKIRNAINTMIVSELEQRGIEGIVSSHGDILWALYIQDMQPITVLSEKIDRTQPTVTVLVNKLEKLGYVRKVKSKEDSRITLVSLTPKGKELEPVFQEVSARLNETIYGGLSDKEQVQLESLLEQIFKRF